MYPCPFPNCRSQSALNYDSITREVLFIFGDNHTFSAPPAAVALPPKVSTATIGTQTNPPGEAEYREGLVHYSHALYLKALPYFTDAAKQHYPAAYLMLYRLYKPSRSIGHQNTREAAGWKAKVVAQSSWFLAQANTGNADAQFNLGLCCQSGIGVQQDERCAVSWFTQASLQGHAPAQYALGRCYQNAAGVQQDARLAVTLYKKAADQGHAPAQYTLGVISPLLGD